MKGGGQDMTFFEVYDRWLNKHKAEIKQSTVATYYSLGNTSPVLLTLMRIYVLLMRM